MDTDHHRNVPDIEHSGTSSTVPPPDFLDSASPPVQTPPPEFTSNAPTPGPEMITTTNQAPAAAPTSPTEPTDPRIGGLKAMFPDFDDGLLLSVLESVGGDQDRAVDVLLGMSDPDYVSTHQGGGAPEPVRRLCPVSQTDLDEQLARRLMLEEEQQAAQYQRRSQAAGWPNLRDNSGSGTYQPRAHSGRSPQQQPQQPASGERDTVAEFQESFSKIAETGKKTFSSIMSKVKAKMQEFDQPQSQRQGEPSNPNYSYANAQPSWSAGQPRTNTYAQPPPTSYYDPNGPIEPPARGYSVNAAPPARGYNMDSPPTRAHDPDNDDSLYTDPPAVATSHQRNTSTGGSAYPAASTSPPLAPVSPPRVSASPPPSAGTPRPPSTGAGTPPSFDASKLGILPKRPVSLLRPGTQSPPPRHVSGDDDDEQEYAENPFEEGEGRG
ncbi:hypothetical protein BV22DRAFT_1105624 [Leucogyrophana mollusca]|uniref:Uncharacterized protein n=1 Tax=Leucogyrophana mollusca TaxID=85980 RepID=A0ACB8BEQ6_9AGAM|nr:hypothetical protein BV22DRAFT_1105624 [Leucogyrophana mollusca]